MYDVSSILSLRQGLGTVLIAGASLRRRASSSDSGSRETDFH
jgi:hypothetical protein